MAKSWLASIVGLLEQALAAFAALRRCLPALVVAIFAWTCTLTDSSKKKLLNIKLDDSLAVEEGKYASIRVDILREDGSVYREKVYHGPYNLNPDGELKGVDAGALPDKYQIRIIAYDKEGKSSLMLLIGVEGESFDEPEVILRGGIPVVQVNPDSLVFRVGDPARRITARIVLDSQGLGVAWSSTKPSVASVDSAGRVSPRSRGTSVITARARMDTAAFGTVTVTVTGITVDISPDSLELTLGNGPASLQATVTGDASAQGVHWRAGDDAVASVTQSGVVTPVRQGQTWIYARSRADTSAQDSIPLRVLPDTSRPRATGVRMLTPSPLALTEGGLPHQAEAQVLPLQARQELIWSSRNASIATVDGQGLIAPKGFGQTVITVRAKEDTALSDTLQVSVVRPPPRVDTVAVTPDSMTLYLGGAGGRLEVRFVPADTAVKPRFRSSDTSVAKVDDRGRVSAAGVGDAVVRVTPLGVDTVRDSAKITVKRDVPVIQAGPDRKANLGDSLDFALRVTQAYGGIRSLRWDLDGDGVPEGSLSDTVRKDTSLNLGYRYRQANTFLALFSVEDTEGNKDSVGVRVVIGSQAPFVDIVKPGRDTTLTTRAITLEYLVDSLRKTRVLQLQEGVNKVVVAETSQVSGLVGKDSVVIWVDTEAPRVRITAPDPGFLTRLGSVAVDWTVDGVPQSARRTESLAGKQGAIAIVRDAVDSVGNRGYDTVRILRDTIPPHAPNLTGPATPTRDNTPTWTWTSGGGGGNGSYEARLNAGMPVAATGTSYTPSALPDSTHRLEVRERDDAGNWSPWSGSVPVTVKLNPPLAPNVTVNAARTNAPRWTWSSRGGGNGNFRYRIGNGGYSSTTATEHAPTLATGDYDLCVSETDAVGFGPDSCAQIRVDATAPSLSITAPAIMGRVTSVDPAVSGTASDNVGNRSLTYSLNGGAAQNVVLGSGGNWTFTPNLPDQQTSTVSLTLTDSAGNTATQNLSLTKRSNVVFVRKGATGVPTGRSWQSAYSELHQALDSARTLPPGSQIWVSEGTYQPAAIEGFYTMPSVSLYGGFSDSGTAASLDQRDVDANPTVLQAYQRGEYYILQATTQFRDPTDSVLIHGFTFEEGKFGLVNAISRNLRVVRCTFRGFSGLINTPVFLSAGETTLDSVTITGNTNMEYAGISVYNDAQVNILNSRIVDNKAYGFLGGGLMVYGGSVYTRGSTFAGNTRINGEEEEKVQIFAMMGTFRYNEATTAIEGGESGIVNFGATVEKE